MKLPPEERSNRNIAKLASFFENNKFLREKKQTLDKESMQYLYRNMEFLQLKKGQKVFNYGDVGDLFYIVISGEISIKTPFPE